MTFEFDYRVSGYKAVSVEAENYEEAVIKAETKMNEANFGELEDIFYEILE